MQIDQFISQVLIGIENGQKMATDNTKKKYNVDLDKGGGVSFDIAVTTTYASTNETGKSGKIAIIEVFNAGIEGRKVNNSTNSEVSRIQFSIRVPRETMEEDGESTSNIVIRNSNHINEL